MKSGSARWKSVSKCHKNTTDKNLNVKVDENSEFEKHGNVEEKSDNFDKKANSFLKSTNVKVNLNILLQLSSTLWSAILLAKNGSGHKANISSCHKRVVKVSLKCQ